MWFIASLLSPCCPASQAIIQLTLDHAGANPTNLSVVVTSLGAACACLSALTWREVY
jgi:hypothetical protein